MADSELAQVPRLVIDFGTAIVNLLKAIMELLNSKEKHLGDKCKELQNEVDELKKQLGEKEKSGDKEGISITQKKLGEKSEQLQNAQTELANTQQAKSAIQGIIDNPAKVEAMAQNALTAYATGLESSMKGAVSRAVKLGISKEVKLSGRDMKALIANVQQRAEALAKGDKTIDLNAAIGRANLSEGERGNLSYFANNWQKGANYKSVGGVGGKASPQLESLQKAISESLDKGFKVKVGNDTFENKGGASSKVQPTKSNDLTK